MAMMQASHVPQDVSKIVDYGKPVVLRPETWTGHRFPLLDFIDIGNDLAKGRWAVVLYHDGCPACLPVISQYRVRGKEPRGVSVALVEMPPFSNEGGIQANEHLAHGHVTDVNQWFVTTPVEVGLIDGIVVEVRCQGIAQRLPGHVESLFGSIAFGDGE